jgi:hypothetical protein
MKSILLLAASGVVIAATLPSLPSFDWQAALFVGSIVTVAAAVITVAILTPFVAITIALVTGVIGGTAAGFYWGRQADIKRQQQIESIQRVSNHIDIYFEPSADPKRAAAFQCTIVIYEETDVASQQPTVTTKKVKISAADSKEFYSQVDQQLKQWFTKQVAGDAHGQPRRVKVYMRPYPGEGVYDRIKELAENNGIRNCNVSKSESEWEPALPQ